MPHIIPYLMIPLAIFGILLFVGFRIKRKHAGNTTLKQKLLVIISTHSTIFLFVCLIIAGGLSSVVYLVDMRKIEALNTQKGGIIVDYEDTWPKRGPHWGERYKRKCGFTLTIFLDDGNRYGFDVKSSELQEQINIGDNVNFYYSEDIYPNTGFNAFGLSKDGKVLSEKVSRGLHTAFRESLWYGAFSLVVLLIFIYQCVKIIRFILKNGFENYVNESYSKIK